LALRLLVATCALGTAMPTAEAQDAPTMRIPARKVLFGNGVSSPEVRKEVKPKYNRKAQVAGIQGVVKLQAAVLPDGKIGAVQVVQSLDTKYGLDQEAVKAMKKWVFKPGMEDGKPVKVVIEVEMTFSLKKK
jgi:protein TonB